MRTGFRISSLVPSGSAFDSVSDSPDSIILASQRVVAEWATRRRRAERANDQELQKIPAARSIARLMTTKRDHLTKAETVTVAAIEQGVSILADARALVDRLHAMIRKKAEIEFEPWIETGDAFARACAPGGRTCHATHHVWPYGL